MRQWSSGFSGKMSLILLKVIHARVERRTNGTNKRSPMSMILPSPLRSHKNTIKLRVNTRSERVQPEEMRTRHFAYRIIHRVAFVHIHIIAGGAILQGFSPRHFTPISKTFSIPMLCSVTLGAFCAFLTESLAPYCFLWRRLSPRRNNAAHRDGTCVHGSNITRLYVELTT